MTLDIPGRKVFAQRDVRETPAATATATSVGLTDLNYVLLSTDADTTRDRVLTAGEGIDFTDAGPKGTLTINGESASDTNKGISTYQLTDFTVTAGDVALKAIVVMSVDGDTGTATPAVHNIDILGGNGIVTLGANNDITITAVEAEIDHNTLKNLNAGTSYEHLTATQVSALHGVNDSNTSSATAAQGTIVDNAISPIGSVIAWLKSYTSTPQTLPIGWVEAAGQTLTDADSVYNGQVLPDLNGGIFLRGDTTSGGTGGSDTMAHTHTLNPDKDGASGAEVRVFPDLSTVTTSGASNTENRPPYYNVVWIMRIK